MLRYLSVAVTAIVVVIVAVLSSRSHQTESKATQGVTGTSPSENDSEVTAPHQTDNVAAANLDDSHSARTLAGTESGQTDGIEFKGGRTTLFGKSSDITHDVGLDILNITNKGVTKEYGHHTGRNDHARRTGISGRSATVHLVNSTKDGDKETISDGLENDRIGLNGYTKSWVNSSDTHRKNKSDENGDNDGDHFSDVIIIDDEFDEFDDPIPQRNRPRMCTRNGSVPYFEDSSIKIFALKYLNDQFPEYTLTFGDLIDADTHMMNVTYVAIAHLLNYVRHIQHLKDLEKTINKALREMSISGLIYRSSYGESSRLIRLARLSVDRKRQKLGRFFRNKIFVDETNPHMKVDIASLVDSMLKIPTGILANMKTIRTPTVDEENFMTYEIKARSVGGNLWITYKWEMYEVDDEYELDSGWNSYVLSIGKNFFSGNCSQRGRPRIMTALNVPLPDVELDIKEKLSDNLMRDSNSEPYHEDLVVTFGNLQDSSFGLTDNTYIAVAKLLKTLEKRRKVFRNASYNALQGLVGENLLFHEAIGQVFGHLRLRRRDLLDSKPDKAIRRINRWTRRKLSGAFDHSPYLSVAAESLLKTLRKKRTLQELADIGFVRMPTVDHPNFMYYILTFKAIRNTLDMNAKWSIFEAVEPDYANEITDTETLNLIREGQLFYRLN